MPAIEILSAVCFAVWMTIGFSKFIELTGPGRKQVQSPDGLRPTAVAQRNKQWTPLKRWAIRLSCWCIALTLVPLALYLVNVPSYSYADGKWAAGPRDGWLVAAMGVLTLCALIQLSYQLAALVLNPRASLIRRLARSTVFVLAVAVAFLVLYARSPRN